MASLSSGFRILRSLADVKPDIRHFRRIYESGLRLNSSRTLCTQTNAGAKPQTDAPNPAEQQPSSSSTDETASKNQSAIEELNKLLVEANKQKDELNDKYKRALAESENMRKRLMKQIEEAKMYGIQSFCKDLLEVADVLGKATECVPKEEVKDSNPHLKNLYVGLTMTEAELVKVFKRHGLVPVNPLDEKFDPNFHEALFQQEVEGKEPGTVVVVSKIGYKLHERVVRPALVGVAKG